MAVDMMHAQHINGVNGVSGHEAEVMQGSYESGVGVAYTTNDEVDTSSAFNEQYRQQQLAYQQAMLEQQAEQERQAAAEREKSRVIKTIEVPEISPTAITAAQKEAALQSQQPVQNRVFGLRKDLAGPSTETGHFEHHQQTFSQGLVAAGPESASSSPSTSVPPLRRIDSSRIDTHDNAAAAAQAAASSLKPSDGPRFSVEVIAPAFDKRGYPVFAGRGARIRGYLRTEALEGHEIVVKLTAVISQGSPAALWNGVALMPPEQGHERKVFTVEDHIPLHNGMKTRRSAAAVSGDDEKDYVYSVPFDLNLPLGVSTRWVNGQQTTTAVALPPSYEMSSENDASRREWNRSHNLLKNSGASIKSRSSRMTSFSQNLGTSVKDAVRDGMSEEYRIGCFYKMIFSLQKLPTAAVEPVKRKLGMRKKPKEEPVKVLDSISVPFIFLGEPTSLPPPPHSIPLPFVAPVLLNPSLNMGAQWECERNQAKWSGNFFRVAKRSVDLELHMPAPAVLQAPSVFPFILVIRPADPNLLSTISSAPAFEVAAEADGGTQPGYSTNTPRSGMSRAGRPDGLSSGKEEDGETEPSPVESDGFLNRFKSSISLHRKSSQSALHPSQSTSTLAGAPTVTDGGSTVHGGPQRGSLFGSGGSSSKQHRRPNTAPSGSSDTAGGTSLFGSGGQYVGGLSGLVRVSLIQSTFCVASGPSEVPKSRRRLISEAEVEEVEFATILDEYSKASGLNGHSSDASLAVANEARTRGIRVLRGSFKVGTDATPSFRCQGIEVKYAIKVDLIPFSKKVKKRPATDDDSSSSYGGNNSSSGRPSLNIPSSPTMRNSSSPPMPTIPLPHRSLQSQDSRASISQGSMMSASTLQQPGYAASAAATSRAGGGGAGGGGSRFGGGSSTIVSESALAPRLDKGIGALWADVRMVRSAFAT